MSKAKNGDTVKVHYTGKLNDGSVFDSSENREPLEFQLGSGQLIPGFEKAVSGMTVGDSTTVTIPANEAYGEVNEELILSVEKDRLPADIQPEVGMQLQVQQPNGQPVPVVISDVTDGIVKLDANHPLAGKELIFDIEVVEIA
ncbi:MAG: peptidylprolyl isomerase [Rhodothermaceae bacterium]|nr:peptidylprolyl isomerase [Rhodothermaceae bacterium]